MFSARLAALGATVLTSWFDPERVRADKDEHNSYEDNLYMFKDVYWAVKQGQQWGSVYNA